MRLPNTHRCDWCGQVNNPHLTGWLTVGETEEFPPLGRLPDLDFCSRDCLAAWAETFKQNNKWGASVYDPDPPIPESPLLKKPRRRFWGSSR